LIVGELSCRHQGREKPNSRARRRNQTTRDSWLVALYRNLRYNGMIPRGTRLRACHPPREARNSCDVYYDGSHERRQYPSPSAHV
jgi:hypothetical protein